MWQELKHQERKQKSIHLIIHVLCLKKIDSEEFFFLENWEKNIAYPKLAIGIWLKVL